MTSWKLQKKLIMHIYDVIVIISSWIMQNIFQNFINKLRFTNLINSETARSKLLKFLPEMKIYIKTQNMQKIDWLGMQNDGSCNYKTHFLSHCTAALV